MVDSKNSHIPHDSFFKTSMKRKKVAQDFFRKFLSTHKIRHEVDLSTLKYEEGSFVDDIIGNGEVDILFSVKIDNQPGYLFLLVEHQTKSDKYMPLRIFLYIAMVLKDYWKQNPNFEYLPEVIGSIYYTGESSYTAPRSMRDLFVKREAADDIIGEYPLLEVNSISDAEIREYNRASLMLVINKYLKSNDLAEHLEDVSDIIHQIGEENFLYLRSCLRYTLKNGDSEDPKKITGVFKKSVSPEKGEKIMNMEQRLINEGKAEGEMKEKYRTAKEMLSAGYGIQDISRITKLPINKIKELHG